jgi:hypothetical protein
VDIEVYLHEAQLTDSIFLRWYDNAGALYCSYGLVEGLAGKFLQLFPGSKCPGHFSSQFAILSALFVVDFSFGLVSLFWVVFLVSIAYTLSFSWTWATGDGASQVKSQTCTLVQGVFCFSSSFPL